MSELLVVRLAASALPELLVVRLAASAVEYVVVDGTGARRSEVREGSLADAATQAAGRKVVVLVPGSDVLLAEPVLPLKSGAKLAQIVPFALEEQLATDVELLHFAVGRRDVRPVTPVAVVAHARMTEWLATLAEAGLKPDAMYAETSALPETPNAVTLLIDGGKVYVRRESTPGAVLEVEPLIEAVQLALASGEEERENVVIYIAEGDYERERDLLEGLREFTASLQLKLLRDGPLPLLAAKVAQSTPVNLLQGPYTTKRKLDISFAPWRYAAVLALVFLGVNLGLKAWQYFHYRDAEARLDQQIVEVYQQAMPGAPMPDPGAARKQMEQRLAQMRAGGPVSGLMTTLDALAEGLKQAPGTIIEALSYRNDTADLRMLAPNVDELDRIRSVAGERGVDVSIQSTSPRDSKLEGRLQFKSPGA
jgi:general secretion pathway protein L